MAIASRPQPNHFQIQMMAANHKNYISKLIDSRAVFEAMPTAKNYTMLEPSIRDTAHFAKEGLLTKGGGSLLKIFEDRAKVIYDSAEEYQHKLYVDNNDMRGTVIKVYHENDNDILGKGRREFSFASDVDWFGDRNVLLLDGLQHAPFLVRSIEKDGHYWKYNVVLNIEEYDGYIEGRDLRVGDRFTGMGALRGEAAIERASVPIGMNKSFILFKTPPTSFGWQTEVTDKAWKKLKHYAVRAQSDDAKNLYGNDFFTTTMLDMKFKEETDRQIDLWLAYGQSMGVHAGAILDNVTNRYLESGPGFYQWMKYAVQGSYNPETNVIEYLSNLMAKKWHNNVAPEDRVVDFGTGTLGLKLFREAAIKMGLPYQVSVSDDPNYDVVNKGFDGMHQGIVANKRQITGTYLDTFGKIMVHYLPFLDNDRTEKRKWRGYSIKSGEFLAMDTGLGRGDESNLYIIKDSEEDRMGYGIGAWTPKGSALGNPELSGRYLNTLGSKNAYQILRDAKIALVVKDPQRIMFIKPAIAA